MNLSPQETELVVNALYHKLFYSGSMGFSVAEWKTLFAQFELLKRLAPEKATELGAWLAGDHKAVPDGN